jgi:hypothetical protein
MTYTIDVRLPRPGSDRPTPQQVAGALAVLLPDGATITVRLRP